MAYLTCKENLDLLNQYKQNKSIDIRNKLIIGNLGLISKFIKKI